jgi:drug/metabolite transporter (DMT)-like permease
MNLLLPLLAIISATAIRASDIIFRQALFSLPSIVIVFLEHGVGLIVLSLLYHKYIKDLRHLTRTQIWAMIWTGVFAGMLATLFYTSGLVLVSFASFSVVVLLQQLQPIRGVIAARLVLKEKITKQFV